MIENISVSTFPDYVEEIFQTFLMATPEQLAAATQELNEMTPAPMNTMLEKQPVAEAIEKRRRRRAMIVEDVPPTTPGEVSKIVMQQDVYSFLTTLSLLSS